MKRIILLIFILFPLNAFILKGINKTYFDLITIVRTRDFNSYFPEETENLIGTSDLSEVQTSADEPFPIASISDLQDSIEVIGSEEIAAQSGLLATAKGLGAIVSQEPISAKQPDLQDAISLAATDVAQTDTTEISSIPNSEDFTGGIVSDDPLCSIQHTEEPLALSSNEEISTHNAPTPSPQKSGETYKGVLGLIKSAANETAQADLAHKKGVTSSSSPQMREKSYNWLPKRITVSHIQGTENEILYGTNFTTFGLLFAPPYRLGRFMPMLDLRGHRFDDNTYAANVGVIGRYVPSSRNSFCHILGFNAYYDYRQGGLGYFQQIGVGVEALGKRWDFRGNAYVPFGSKKNQKSCLFDDYIGDYEIINDLLEEVSYSFNAEVGYLAINSKNFLFYTAIGPYYIAGRKCSNSTAGGKFRIRPQYKDYFAVDLSVSYDSLFKTIFQAEFIVYLPLYQIAEQNKRPCGITDRQIYQPVERFEVMALMRQNCWRKNF